MIKSSSFVVSAQRNGSLQGLIGDALPLKSVMPSFQCNIGDGFATGIAEKHKYAPAVVDALNFFVVVDERLDRVHQPDRHLVDLVENEQGLGTFLNTAPHSILDVKLKITTLLKQLSMKLEFSYLVNVDFFVDRKVDRGDEKVDELALHPLSE